MKQGKKNLEDSLNTYTRFFPIGSNEEKKHVSIVMFIIIICCENSVQVICVDICALLHFFLIFHACIYFQCMAPFRLSTIISPDIAFAFNTGNFT